MKADDILIYFNKLNKRQKVLVVALALVIIGVALYRFMDQSFISDRKKFKVTLQKTLSDIETKKAKLPDIKSQQKELSAIRKGYEEMIGEIKEYEKEIPTAASVSQVLGEIMRRSEGLGLDFESIKQDIGNDNEGYLNLKLGIKFYGPYSGTVNYLNRLQNLSDYLAVSSVEIAQTKEGGSRAKTSLDLTMLLLEKGIDLSVKEDVMPAVKVKADPFISKKVVKKDRLKDIKLVGITQAGKESTAIINDEVVRVGSQIKEWKVVNILPDAVVLSDGYDTIPLTVNR